MGVCSLKSGWLIDDCQYSSGANLQIKLNFKYLNLSYSRLYNIHIVSTNALKFEIYHTNTGTNYWEQNYSVDYNFDMDFGMKKFHIKKWDKKFIYLTKCRTKKNWFNVLLISRVTKWQIIEIILNWRHQFDGNLISGQLNSFNNFPF